MANQVVPPRGMRDFLPQEFAVRQQVLAIMAQVVREHGFHQIHTPSLELIERLKSNKGGENESMLFEVLKRGLDPQQPVLPADAVDLGLRYDLTLPLTRYYATHQAELPAIFKAVQTGSVWRAERPQKGRYREFTQFDMDIIGEETSRAEIELISVGYTILQRLGLGESTVIINDRRILADIMDYAGISEDRRGSVLISLDKQDKIGEDGVKAELTEKVGLTAESVDRLFARIGFLESLDISACAGGGDADADGDGVNLYELPATVAAVTALNPGIRISFAPTLVRGMGYYTGLIYEVVNDTYGKSVCGGGRYDNMIGDWSGKPVPAAGFSFGFERIMDIVDPALLGAGRRGLGLAYATDEEFTAALELRGRLLAGGGSWDTVALVKRPKKLKGSFFELLTTQGLGAWLDMSAVPPLGEGESDAEAIAALIRPVD
ncbi:MAG: ATP phosphoribosyltransferase regulatory subunit [Corynebacterium sp.]|nr:ATP phosphoribosyltransferase regulatory subunit [Corynebacterium sp.]